MLEDWWHYVFGVNQVEPGPAALLEHLQQKGFEASGQFRGDDQGWFEAEIAYSPELPPSLLNRYLAGEEGIRTELNTWAAVLETAKHNTEAVRLMQQVIGTTQMFTLKQPIKILQIKHALELSQTICRFLAQVTDGFYTIQGHGFYDEDGRLLVHQDEVG